MCAEHYYLIACFISLILLIVSYMSLKGIHKQMRMANLREYCRSYREILHKLPLEMFQESIPERFEFTQSQVLVVCSYFGLLFEEYRLHKDRFIDRATWKDWEGNLDNHAGRPGFVKAWNNAKTFFVFEGEFASFIEERIDRARCAAGGTESEPQTQSTDRLPYDQMERAGPISSDTVCSFSNTILHPFLRFLYRLDLVSFLKKRFPGQCRNAFVDSCAFVTLGIAFTLVLFPMPLWLAVLATLYVAYRSLTILSLQYDAILRIQAGNMGPRSAIGLLYLGVMNILEYCLLFACLYRQWQLLVPDVACGLPLEVAWYDTVYFSFVTQLTIGYGDLIPVGLGRSVSWQNQS